MKARLLSGARLRALVVLLSGAIGGFFALSRAFRPMQPSPVPALAAPTSATRTERDPLRQADQRCLAERSALLGPDAEPLPAVDRAELRAQLLGRVKAAPVLFVSEPQLDHEDERAQELRGQLERAPSFASFDRVVGQVRREPALARAVFMRQGYLYVDRPDLVSQFGALTLSLLFRDALLRIERGSQVLEAKRTQEGDYEYTSGPEQGQRAKLLLFDRVSPQGAVPLPPLHADLEPLWRELGFDELAVSGQKRGRLAVEFGYGTLRAPAVVRADRGKLVLECEALGEQRSYVLARRAAVVKARELHERLLSVVRQQVDEGLPFDEPKTEEGQQDGKLRPEWRSAYFEGRSSFEFNGDRYSVFDHLGRPRPPQVCIDFILDTFERAGGAWWQPRDRRRERSVGRLSFDGGSMENRRSVEQFIEFARTHLAEFEVYDPPPEERVPLRQRERFFRLLYQRRAQFRRGDIVAILGPREDEKLHYHSFFIVDSDPLSGMPTELAANAGRPRIRTWEGEMSNAPRRSIFARIRPRTVWLESFLLPQGGASADAPESAGPTPSAG